MNKKNKQIENKKQEEPKENMYVPRNKIVAAKERFYDRMKLSVRQVDFFIAGCILLMVGIIAISVFG